LSRSWRLLDGLDVQFSPPDNARQRFGFSPSWLTPTRGAGRITGAVSVRDQQKRPESRLAAKPRLQMSGRHRCNMALDGRRRCGRRPYRTGNLFIATIPVLTLAAAPLPGLASEVFRSPLRLLQDNVLVGLEIPTQFDRGQNVTARRNAGDASEKPCCRPPRSAPPRSSPCPPSLNDRQQSSVLDPCVAARS